MARIEQICQEAFRDVIGESQLEPSDSAHSSSIEMPSNSFFSDRSDQSNQSCDPVINLKDNMKNHNGSNNVSYSAKLKNKSDVFMIRKKGNLEDYNAEPVALLDSPKLFVIEEEKK